MNMKIVQQLLFRPSDEAKRNFTSSQNNKIKICPVFLYKVFLCRNAAAVQEKGRR